MPFLPPFSEDEILTALSREALVLESSRIQEFASELGYLDPLIPAIQTTATALIEEAKRHPHAAFSVESLLHEYGLDTQEGVALLCLAEAFLRIPDTYTKDALLHDLLHGPAWDDHIGHSDSLWINASSWGLLLAGKVVELDHLKVTRPSAWIGKWIGRLGEPVVRNVFKHLIHFLGAGFVLGRTMQEALSHARAFTKKGAYFSYDMLGEGARTDSQAEHYYQSYVEALDALHQNRDANAPLYTRPSLSIKLSALHPRYELLHAEEVLATLLPKIREMVVRARSYGLSLTIDAEEANRLDVSLLLLAELFRDPAFEGMEGIGLAVQAYQKRALPLLKALHALGRKHRLHIPVRLVKGAYWDTEIKKAQGAGLSDFPVYSCKNYTDISYLRCADFLLQHTDHFYPQFATHNALTLASILTMADHYGVKAFEFQRLHGMGEQLHLVMMEKYGTASRIYAPVGTYQDLLPYLIRRMLENGANSSFLHQLAHDTPLETLLKNPLDLAKEEAYAPSNTIAAPRAIFAPRVNAPGYDLGYRYQLLTLLEGIKAYKEHQWHVTPLVAGITSYTTTPRTVFCPAHRETAIGTVTDATEALVYEAGQAAASAYPAWNRTLAETRARLLEACAETLIRSKDELLTLCILEAGKNLQDSIAEWREAIDMCRYYAQEIRKLAIGVKLPGVSGEDNTLSLHGRGVFVCISPWNFPMAIFIGQIAAALAAGNCVLAKPAEQTCLIAYRIVRLMHQAGIPADVLQLLPGSGKHLGPVLLQLPMLAGVTFTGSTATAKYLHKQLAERPGAILPLIAETGGQNAMIVDSSAHMEQAIDDIMLSAFGSAGQRCSALRVLYVQEEVADRLLPLLKGAIKTLHIGDPTDVSTDIGPVISHEARLGLERHLARMQKEATLIARATLNKAYADQGHFVAPHAFEIQDISQLPEEVFGPILHVIRYKAEELEQIVTALNQTGYGLTLGIHSRIKERVDFITERARVGNIYVNRSMIGAVVGSQPFGGEGLSGTGPKAGGPHYLLRFMSEQTVTINTASIGGNVSLLTGK